MERKFLTYHLLPRLVFIPFWFVWLVLSTISIIITIAVTVSRLLKYLALIPSRNFTSSEINQNKCKTKLILEAGERGWELLEFK